MPTGGAAIMRKGEPLEAREKGAVLGFVTSFVAKIASGCSIYDLPLADEVQYLHPVASPGKVNAGRVGANQNMRSIGKSTNPINVKFQGKVLSINKIFVARPIWA